MPLKGYAQTEVHRIKVDSSNLFVFLTANFSYNFTLADLRKEFGDNLSIGADFGIKTKNNWSVDFGFKYHFSGKFDSLIGEDLFKYIASDGNFFTENGLPMKLNVDFRGLNFQLQAGKVIPVSQKFRNSGIWVKLGIGVMQHYLHIKTNQNEIPSLTNEYKKGYDRLTLGFTLNQFIGYMHLTKKNLLCFYGGIEFSEIFAKRQREYDFNLMGKDNSKLFESMIGIKVGWIIPLYKHDPHSEFEYR